MPIQKPEPKVLPKLVRITPEELYKRQVKSIYDNFRALNNNMDYIPSQFGGLFGQRSTLESEVVLEIIDFEVK